MPATQCNAPMGYGGKPWNCNQLNARQKPSDWFVEQFSLSFIIKIDNFLFCSEKDLPFLADAQIQRNVWSLVMAAKKPSGLYVDNITYTAMQDRRASNGHVGVDVLMNGRLEFWCDKTTNKWHSVSSTILADRLSHANRNNGFIEFSLFELIIPLPCDLVARQNNINSRDIITKHYRSPFQMYSSQFGSVKSMHKSISKKSTMGTARSQS